MDPRAAQRRWQRSALSVVAGPASALSMVAACASMEASSDCRSLPPPDGGGDGDGSCGETGPWPGIAGVVG